MADCCCAGPADAGPAFECPACRSGGPRVDELTVKALLTHAALQRFEPGAHRFCPSGSCAVVYFDAAGRTFTTADLVVRVWQKEPAGLRTLCYCFGENERDIRGEVERSGVSEAVSRVRGHIEAGRCACEVRNPRGACCLGDVIQAVKRIAEHGEGLSDR